MSFMQIPISIVLGILLGIATGLLLTVFFKKKHMRDSVKILIILSVYQFRHRLVSNAI